jgi:hypothetical protein
MLEAELEVRHIKGRIHLKERENLPYPAFPENGRSGSKLHV